MSAQALLRSFVFRRALLGVVLAQLGALTPARAQMFDAVAVELVQFSDYQCPFSQRAEATLDQLEARYGASLRIVVHHLPLDMHPLARAAALAAEAARNQGQLQAMHDRLFANQAALARDDLIAHARALGLDVARFIADLDSADIAARVDRDIAIAGEVGASGTPTYFINGRVVNGAQPLATFTALVDEELAAARAANRFGEPWLDDRLSANNVTLWGFLRGGQVPPAKAAAAPAVAKNEGDSADAGAEEIFRVRVDNAVDAFDGPADALVTVVEFMGYECPFCRKLEGALDELMARYPGRMRRVVKHNPLSFHLRSRPAAAAAICAQAQGRFWQMHDSLIAGEVRLDDESLKNRASVIGLDLGKFERCLAAPDTEARIVKDIALSEEVDARATPTSFVNGRRVVGAKPVEELVAIVEAEIVRANARLAEGVAAKDLYASLIKGGKVWSPLDTTVHTFPDRPDTPLLGNAKAKLRVTVFADFQCPYSARMFPMLEQIVRTFPGRVGIAFRHYPLDFHPQARPAAVASVCAFRQKRFWETARLFFAEQDRLGDVAARVAQRVGLDDVKLASCINEGGASASVDDDIAAGKAGDIKGTPSVFVGGRRYIGSGAYTFDTFKPIIEAMLAGREP